MRAVLAIIEDPLKQLELFPAVVDEDIGFELGPVVGIHHEASGLRQTIYHSRVDEELATLLHLAEADRASRQSVRHVAAETGNLTFAAPGAHSVEIGLETGEI